MHARGGGADGGGGRGGAWKCVRWRWRKQVGRVCVWERGARLAGRPRERSRATAPERVSLWMWWLAPGGAVAQGEWADDEGGCAVSEGGLVVGALQLADSRCSVKQGRQIGGGWEKGRSERGG